MITHLVIIEICFLSVLGDVGFFRERRIHHLGNLTDSYLRAPQIIQKYGYTAESHFVVTDDGYILEMHRILPKEGSAKKKLPIFLHHGLLGASTDYLLIGKNSLAFLLSDLGFDVWIGNSRGNYYARGHVTYFPDEKRFWNYSWHDSALHDLPAEIDHILYYSGREKIVYIGWSMGTTLFFALTSSQPKYNDKIEVACLMAPVGYLKHVRSPLLRILAPFSGYISNLAFLLGNGEFLPHSKFLTFLGRILCESTDLEIRLCMNILYLIVGKDPASFDKKLLPVLINHYPSGYSIKGVNHYAQLLKSGKFRQYDYGPVQNVKEYGTSTPPEYNVSSITTPIYIYQGLNDLLSVMPDVKRLVKDLPSVKNVKVAPYSKFSHLDFVFSNIAKEQVYNALLKDLLYYLDVENELRHSH